MKLKNIVSCSLLISSCLLASCDDFLTTAPSVDLNDDVILAEEAGLQILLTGTYKIMKNGVDDLHATSPIGMKSYSTGVGSRDISSYPAAGNEIYAGYRFDAASYNSDGALPSRFWKNYYEIINNANILIANSHNSVNTADQLKGQALILRARCYYQLVRLYQHTYILAKDKLGVPLYLEPNNVSTEPKPRSTVEQVYQQIEKDLLEAVDLLEGFKRPDFTYYDQDVAYFLLADMYLTKNQWQEARDMAMKITGKYNLMSNEQYRSGFAEKNDEWILGYKQTGTDSWYYNSIGCVWYWETGSQWNARMFYPTREFVEDILTWDDARNVSRKVSEYYWYISDKFNDRYLGGLPVLSDMCDFRAAEMYLVEAEARARLNDAAGARTILNQIQVLRNATITQPSDNLLEAILLERRKELYGEGIDLWDVKRLQLPVKRDEEWVTVTNAEGVEERANVGHYYSVDIPANSQKLVLQVPKYEMTNNPNMEQNPDPETTPVFTP